jgi:Flp pilus assembly protein TadD
MALAQSAELGERDARPGAGKDAVYYLLGRSQEAVEPLKQAIRLKPDFARAHACLGMVYVK